MGEGRPAPQLDLVPHTHWDREWYEPFQRFRLRLVDLMDDVVARAGREPGFRFTLDGQLAAVEDYLEVRPEQRGAVAELVRSGQLAVGPFQILLDEFLCSGETIVRNLRRGTSGAEALGRVMPVGYLPDMFGHCAQMPQLLARAGLRHACVWRGVPAAVDRAAFRWESPDGSSVRTEYLIASYGNASHLFSDPETVLVRAQHLAQDLAIAFPGGTVLAMYGTDHATPLPTLMSDVDALRSQGMLVEVRTLADVVGGRDPDEPGLPVVRGELRSHARANILPGVLSVRWQLKEAMGRAERMVARYAEPLATLESADWPERFLDMAWQRLIDASCHDSVTGCGVDETALQVAARIAEAEHLGQAVRDRVTGRLAAQVASDAVLVVNPSPVERSGLVEVELAVEDDSGPVVLELADGRRVATQEVARPSRDLSDERVAADDLPVLFRRVHGRELFGRQVHHVEHDLGSDPPQLVFHVGASPGSEPFDAAAEQARAAAVAAERPGAWRARIRDEARRTVLAPVTVPALGWSSARRIDVAAQGSVEGAEPPAKATGDGPDAVLDNGRLRVAVRADGALRLTTADGTVLDRVGGVVESGDVGDTYNYAPPAQDEEIVDPVDVEVRVLECGPLRAALEVRRADDWPLAQEDGGRSRTTQRVRTEVLLRAELRVHEPFVRLAVSFVNASRDHRVRLVTSTAGATTTSAAEGQFAVVERGPEPEGGTSGETPIATYPAYGFVDAGGAALLLGRPSEYEVVDGGAAVALTLVRGVGWLSRDVHPMRDVPAGPQLPTPDAQCLGKVRVELAVLPHGGGWQDAGVLEALEAWAHPLLVRPGAAADGGALPPPRAGLSVTGRGVVLSALRRHGDELELRVVAETDEPTTAVVGPALRSARLADLLGRPGAELALAGGELRLPLGPWEVATVLLGRPIGS